MVPAVGAGDEVEVTVTDGRVNDHHPALGERASDTPSAGNRFTGEIAHLRLTEADEDGWFGEVAAPAEPSATSAGPSDQRTVRVPWSVVPRGPWASHS